MRSLGLFYYKFQGAWKLSNQSLSSRALKKRKGQLAFNPEFYGWLVDWLIKIFGFSLLYNVSNRGMNIVKQFDVILCIDALVLIIVLLPYQCHYPVLQLTSSIMLRYIINSINCRQRVHKIIRVFFKEFYIYHFLLFGFQKFHHNS